MTAVPKDFAPGLAGVVAFETEIAEPDKDGGALRYRGVDIEDLVNLRVTFGDVWGLLVDGRFGEGLTPAEPFPLPIHTGNVRVDVQAGLAMLAPDLGLPAAAGHRRRDRARPARPRIGDGPVLRRTVGPGHLPAGRPAAVIDECSTVTARFMTRWQGEPDPRHVEAIDAYWVSAAEHGMNASTFTARVIASTGADVAASLSGAVGAMSGPLHGGAPARVLPMIEEVERTGDARGRGQRHPRPRREADGIRASGVPRRGSAGPGAAGHRQAARGAALRGGRRVRAGRADRTARATAGPRDRDQRGVLGRGHPGLRGCARRDDAGDVHLRAHRGLVCAHPGTETAGQAGAAGGHLRRPRARAARSPSRVGTRSPGRDH